MTKLNYLTILLAYMLVVFPAGWLLGKLMRHLGKTTMPTFPMDEGTKRMGLWIGCTERIILLTFVLTNHYDAVGLLVAAKSILRVSDSEVRKQTEYVLLGTLLSLATAVVVGEITKWLVSTK